jgi:hypothetical protein
MSPEVMEHNRIYRRAHPHHQSPESKKKSLRKSRLTAYGLTQAQFDLLLDAQVYTCGMCHEPFAEGRRIHVDHDHNCCKEKSRSCGKCVRGLLCITCNIVLGHLDRRYTMARAYLDQPSVDVQRIRTASTKIPVVERFLEDLPKQARPLPHDQLHYT